MSKRFRPWVTTGIAAVALSAGLTVGAAQASAEPESGTDDGSASAAAAPRTVQKPSHVDRKRKSDIRDAAGEDGSTPPHRRRHDDLTTAPATHGDSGSGGQASPDVDDDGPAEQESGESDLPAPPTPDRKRDKRATRLSHQRAVVSAPGSTDVSAPTNPTPSADADSDPVPVAAAAAKPQPAVESEVAVVTPQTVAMPQAAHPQNLLDAVVGAVTSVVSATVGAHGSGGAPESPVSQPQDWAMAAAARRELEPQIAPTLTYTPGPSLTDLGALIVQNVLGSVAKVTGIDIYGVLGALLASADPPFFLALDLNSQKTTWTADDGTPWKVWQFRSNAPTDKVVVAFHGGGFIYQPNLLNWIDYTSMARDTGATVIVPLYPLATTAEGAATKVIPDAADFVSDQIALHGAENVSLYADSAGSTIAISAVRTLLLAGQVLPASMVLLSMSVDSTLQNPDVRSVDDPIFNIDDLSTYDSHFYDGISKADPRVSPLFFEQQVLDALPPTTIYVGEREILYPDTLLLYQRAVDEGAPISVVVGTGLLHDWAAAGNAFYYSQAAVVRPDVYRELGLTEGI